MYSTILKYMRSSWIFSPYTKLKDISKYKDGEIMTNPIWGAVYLVKKKRRGL